MKEKLAALYPIANVLALTGLLAAILLLMGLEPPLASAISLWFGFFAMLLVYGVGRKPLKLVGLHRHLLALLSFLGFLALFLSLTLSW